MTKPTDGGDPHLLAAWVQLRIGEMMRILKSPRLAAYGAFTKTVQDASDTRLESASVDQDALRDAGRSTGCAWLADRHELRDPTDAARGDRESADFATAIGKPLTTVLLHGRGAAPARRGAQEPGRV